MMNPLQIENPFQGDSAPPSGRYSARNNNHRVSFICKAPRAKSVYLVGDFNYWNGSTHPMNRMPDGQWTLSLELHHGYHHYMYLVDGVPTLDPNSCGTAHNEENQRVSLVAVS
jgi:1,4-alpha-glucan branching enzyme